MLSAYSAWNYNFLAYAQYALKSRNFLINVYQSSVKYPKSKNLQNCIENLQMRSNATKITKIFDLAPKQKLLAYIRHALKQNFCLKNSKTKRYTFYTFILVPKSSTNIVFSYFGTFIVFCCVERKTQDQLH